MENEVKKNVWIWITESLRCLVEINMVNQLYFGKKNKLKKKSKSEM